MSHPNQARTSIYNDSWHTVLFSYYANQPPCKYLWIITDGNGNIRLVESEASYQGHVQIKVDGVWSSVCDDGWGIEDANVACKELGYR